VTTKGSVVAGCIALAALGCSHTDREAILKTDRTWAVAPEARNLEAAVSFWADDAVVIDDVAVEHLARPVAGHAHHHRLGNAMLPSAGDEASSQVVKPQALEPGCLQRPPERFANIDPRLPNARRGLPGVQTGG